MSKIDWSQFIPTILAEIIGAILVSTGAALWAYRKSDKFQNWISNSFTWLDSILAWLAKKWRVIFVVGLFIILESLLFRVFMDWKVVSFSVLHLLLILFVYTLLNNRFITSNNDKTLQPTPNFLPIPIRPGFGNQYWRKCYLDPPLGEVELGKAKFQLNSDSLIFDTNETLHYFKEYPDRSKEIELSLPEPTVNIKSVHFLINSSNSKDIYANEKVGRIVLVFKDVHPYPKDLVLGKNIREWSVGNPGKLIRETTDNSVTVVWKGMNKFGTNAVIDCLEIHVPEALRKNALEKILFLHNPTNIDGDTLGVHFFIFGISLEIEEG